MRCPAWGTSFFAPARPQKWPKTWTKAGEMACPATKTPENVDGVGKLACPATKTPENVDEGRVLFSKLKICTFVNYGNIRKRC